MDGGAVGIHQLLVIDDPDRHRRQVEHGAHPLAQHRHLAAQAVLGTEVAHHRHEAGVALPVEHQFQPGHHHLDRKHLPVGTQALQGFPMQGRALGLLRRGEVLHMLVVDVAQAIGNQT